MALISVGTCAAFGGMPHAKPNPTGAVPVSEIITDKPVINISGCPPIAEAMAGTIAYLITFDKLPDLDHLNRPKAFFGDTIHDRCYRRPFYDKGLFAKSFDDEGARKGWCLYEVGCKGPVTYNACATLKWNGGVSFPIQSGHGCLGCSEPDFWDKGGFYRPLSDQHRPAPRRSSAARRPRASRIGVASALLARRRKQATRCEGAAIMNLLDFARGPALEIAFAVFVFGVAWRLLSLLLLPWARDRSVARATAPPALVGAAKGFVRHLWPPQAARAQRAVRHAERLRVPSGARHHRVRAGPAHPVPARSVRRSLAESAERSDLCRLGGDAGLAGGRAWRAG